LRIVLALCFFLVFGPLAAATLPERPGVLGQTAQSAPATPQKPQPGPRRPVVAVIDSGIARTTELQPLVLAEYDLGSDPPRRAFYPRYDHGTMVATILAREARHDVSIITFRIDDPAGCPANRNPPCQPSPEPIKRAIREASRLRVDAINISLTLGNDQGIVDAIRNAAALGIPVVLAAGNEGLDHPDNLPMALAAYPQAVLVGALDAAGHTWSGSNRPDHLPQPYNFVWRFGVAVPTVLADGAKATATGTSFAVPFETARLVTARSQQRLRRAAEERAATSAQRVGDDERGAPEEMAASGASHSRRY
jgi:hypothetical protein